MQILALHVIALPFAFSIALYLGPLVRQLVLRKPVPFWHIAIGLEIPIVLASILLVRCAVIDFGHFRSLIYYPPTWTAALLVLPELWVSRRWCPWLMESSLQSGDLGWASLLWIAAPIGGALIALLDYQPPSNRGDSRKNQGRDAASAEDFGAWISSEAPIGHPAADRFGASTVAERIAFSFFANPLRTWAVVGPRGAGKSSIVEMICHLVTRDKEFIDRASSTWSAAISPGSTVGRLSVLRNCRPPLIIPCVVSAWGSFSDPPQVVLRRVLDTLSKRVDCLSIGNLPAEYMDSLKGVSKDFLKLPLPVPSLDPLQQLERLAPILSAINARLIVFIEDLDRNPPDDATTTAIEAMLDRLKHVGSIGFVVVIGTTT
ncbi:MAG TPA: hypothetical protein VG055_33555 [Planctomycetaceae bacterium]|nr:hypothetical protein [Planctomycetaceae bacterium]